MSEWQETEIGRIPSDWNISRADLYCKTVTDGTHNSPKKCDKGYSLVTSKHIKGTSIDFNDTYLISKNDYEEINRRSKVDQWNVIISMIGEYCGFVFLEKNEHIEYAIKNVGLFKTDNEIDGKWLFYYLDSHIGRHQLRLRRSGTSQPYLALGSLRELPIIFPTKLEEKKSIVKILSNLDSKIDNLQRQNQTLEKIAQTLFKQWFVDFNFPDETGNPYKDNGGEMVGSELGEIPKGWKVSPLKDVLKVKHGFAFKGEFITTEKTDKILVTPGNFQIGGGFKNHKFKYYSDENIPLDYILKKNDLVVTMTDLSKEGDTLGFPAFVPEIKNKTILHNQRVGLVEDNRIDISFLYFLFCRREYRSHILATATGTTVRHTSPSRIYDFEFVLPAKAILESFIKIASKVICKIQINFEQIQTLTKTRDTILPKLMSGKIRIKD